MRIDRRGIGRGLTSIRADRRGIRQNEPRLIPFTHAKFADRLHVLVRQLNRSPQHRHIRSTHRTKPVLDACHPRDCAPVIVTNAQIHAHLHLASQTAHDSNHIRVRPPRRHEINQRHRPRFSRKHRLNNQRVGKIATLDGNHALLRSNLPEAVVLRAQQRSKASVR